MAKELLKEAIADAKAVREVALQNAKMALEEAFDSKIKSMLSAKLAEEIEEDVELEEVYEEDETSEGVSYEEDDKDAANEEFDLEEDIDEEINLDELMAELEELSYEEDEDGVKEGEDVELEESEEPVDEGVADAANKLGKTLKDMAAYAKDTKIAVDPDQLQSIVDDYEATSDLGKFFQKLSAVGFVSKSTGKGKSFGAKAAGSDMGTDAFGESEEFNIDALIAEIEAELEEGKANDEKVKEAKRKNDKEKQQMEEELAEALSTVTTLQETISEMNLLNSKLLYCNKLFRANSLNESQKIKVVDALDKASTTGEAKLVFETLQESFAFTGVEKRAIKEGLGRASKPAGVAPKKVLSESVDETVSRFQKLANINK